MKSLKRTVYHIDGKDYESNEVITLKFNIQRVSIQTILEKANDCYIHVKSFAKEYNEYHGTVVYPDVNCKVFVLGGYVSNMANFLISLGYSEYSEINRGFFNIIHSCYRKPSNIGQRYKGIICFDPITKAWEMKSNSPSKINGNQSIINGKLWRRYYLGKHVL